MKTLEIGSSNLMVKDYHCAGLDGEYIPKDKLKLWLYINLTNRCNAHCPFCVNTSVNTVCKEISIAKLRHTLKKIKDAVNGVSITGGEPMLFPDLVDEAATVVTDVLGADTQLELVTNGTRLQKLSALQTESRFSSIHISRHCIHDADHTALMCASAPTWNQIKKYVSEQKDPAKVVLNCVLQKGGVDSPEAARSYLELAAWAGVKNVSFVGMFQANQYCRDHYVSPQILTFRQDFRFTIWNQYHDYTFCSCSSGDYLSEHGYIRFYYRCPGVDRASYVRQLVYEYNDQLLAGFGGPIIEIGD